MQSAFALGLLTAAIGAMAQQGAAQAPGPGRDTAHSVTTPDGSRFLLLPTPAFPHVTWTVATLADPWLEPAGLEGLTAAIAEASLAGTWRTGSADGPRERQALLDQEDAVRALFANPADPAARERAQNGAQLLRSLARPEAFRAMLADLPAHGVEVVWRDGLVAFQLTTLPEALERVAACWFEWREEPALRTLAEVWPGTVMRLGNQLALDPALAVRTELLALALPGHPLARQLDRPNRALPTRREAFEGWQARLHPRAAVHVLVGDFDPNAAREVLQRTFRSTSLPAPQPAAVPPPRPITSLRRATVRGTSQPICACAWVIPDGPEPALVETGLRWFAGGPDSFLGRAVAARSKGAAVRASAPWPPAPGGRSLFVVEVLGGDATEGLADLVLDTARAAAQRSLTEAELWPAVQGRQRGFGTAANDPRWLGLDLARTALRWPGMPPGPRAPTMVDPAALQRWLTSLFAGQPVLVEGRP
jgi:hypothetical protein